MSCPLVRFRLVSNSGTAIRIDRSADAEFAPRWPGRRGGDHRGHRTELAAQL